MIPQRSELVNLTKQLVAIESTNIGSFEYKVAEFIEQWLKKETGIEPIRNYIIDNRFNVVAELPGDPALQDVVIICHMDTVPTGENWNFDPFTGEPKTPAATPHPNRIYGRGALDMKAGVALGMIAFRDAVRNAKASKRTLRFIASADEEIEMLGAVQAVKSGYITKDSLVFDIEPSDGEIVTGHKGKIWYRIRALGKPAHGSTPWEGVQAIVAISQVVCELDRRISLLPVHPVFGNNSVCFGTLHCGNNINIVADRSELEIDMRIVPGFAREDANAMLQDIFSEVGQKVPGIDLQYEIIAEKPCIDVHEDAALVKTFQRAIQEELGRDAMPSLMTGYTDSGVVAAMTGNKNCLSFGPGGEGFHQSDEWVSIDSMEQTHQVIHNVLDQLLFR